MLLKAIEDKNDKQVKAIENQGKKLLDAIEKNDELKDDEAKNEALLQDGLKELFESYPYYFSTFVKNELKQLATSEKNIEYKKFSQDFFFFCFFFFDGFSFYKRYSKPYIL